MFALRYSRSPYFDNHLSEVIQTWTICTLLDWLSFHAIGPQGPCPGTGAIGSKSSTCSKCGISGLKFLEVHILTTTYQKAFILGPKVPYRIGSHSITLDP